MKKIRILLSSIISAISIGSIIGAIYVANPLAITNEVDLLTEAVKNDDLQAYQRARGSTTIIEVGSYAYGAIINEQLYTWGPNTNGQCGMGHTSPINTPTLVPAFIGHTVTEISFADIYAGAIVDNEVYMWGNNDDFQLGLGLLFGQSTITTPTLVTGLPGGTKSSLATSDGGVEYHSGVIVDGRIFMWGSNSRSQLATRDSTGRISPTEAKKKDNIPNNARATALSLGSRHSVAVYYIPERNASVICTWGDNKQFGELGYSVAPYESRDYITPLFDTRHEGYSLIGQNIYISASEHTTLASVDGTLWSWGKNKMKSSNKGLLGRNHDGVWSYAKTVSNFTSGVQHVKMLGTNGYVIKNGALYGWGNNSEKELSQSSGDWYATPILLQDGGFTQVAGQNSDYKNLNSESHSKRFAIKNGKIYEWGRRSFNTDPQPTVFNIYDSQVIDLNNSTDPNNYRTQVVYNLTASDIKNIVERSSNRMVLPAPNTYYFTNPIDLGATPYNGIVAGVMTRRIECNYFPILTDLTIRGFTPVNVTSEFDLDTVTISLKDEVFTNKGVNQIVEEANADATGKNSDLAKQIIKDYEPIVSINNYTVDFPKNMKFVKFHNFSYIKDSLNDKKWIIKFSTFVDRYYKRSGQNIIISSPNDVPEKFAEQHTIIDLPTVVSREYCVDDNNKIIIKNKEIDPQTTPSKFFMALTNSELGGTVVNRALLDEYIDIRFIPIGAPIEIIPLTNDMLAADVGYTQKISFKLLTNETFENYGKWINITERGNKQYEEDIHFNITLRASHINSNDNAKSLFCEITTGDFIDLIAPNNQLDSIKAPKYLAFNDFPENTTYKFLEETVVNKNEEGQLQFNIIANQYHNVGSFNPIQENFDVSVPMHGFLPAYDLREHPIEILPSASKKIVNSESFYNSMEKDGEVFARDELNKYLDMRAIPYNAKLTLTKVNTSKNFVNFILHADRYYDNDGRTIKTAEGYSKEFTIPIRRLDIFLIILLISLGIFVIWFIRVLIVYKRY